MRVLHLVEAMGGGVARHVFDLMPEQLKLGHQIEMLYSDSPARLDHMAKKGLPRMAALGVTGHSFPMQREVGYRDLGIALRIAKFVREHGPYDVVHAHSSKAGAYLRMVNVPGARVYTPNAFITMDPLIGKAKRLVYATVERLLSWRGELVIAVSDQERDHALSIGIPGDRIRVVPSGITPVAVATRAQARAALGLDDSTLLVGFVARFISQKAPEMAIEAFCRLTDEERKGARLVMVGYGPLERRTRAVAEKYPAEKIVWAGDGDGPALMPAFDAYLLTSRYESFGYVLLEAANSGAALIATRVGVAENLITDGKSGLLVPIDDPEAARKALARVLGDAEFRKSLQTQVALECRRFTAEAMAVNTLKVYEEAISLRKKR